MIYIPQFHVMYDIKLKTEIGEYDENEVVANHIWDNLMCDGTAAECLVEEAINEQASFLIPQARQVKLERCKQLYTSYTLYSVVPSPIWRMASYMPQSKGRSLMSSCSGQNNARYSIIVLAEFTTVWITLLATSFCPCAPTPE